MNCHNDYVYHFYLQLLNKHVLLTHVTATKQKMVNVAIVIIHVNGRMAGIDKA